ncbi:OmpP1/FadL family transporter [Natronospira bacteriovora]|uniref:Outer membrane protein transport protein n=1 Tax=Natronospira bacteriovora TaxID=3069753 RepID=A0ABU0W7X7_9GAMM|nr:outer membrane protein transport protein [Natronospira sp. AB-CW4]MDQ2070052.1 outer membrane protein transport protein [Natronospira sp. AB-CW4]
MLSRDIDDRPVSSGMCRKLPLRWCLSLLLTGSLVAPVVSADEFHYRDVLIGNRASAMGGAYTAISDDPSGLYYNPAGIVHADQLNLSGSVNAWHSTRVVYKDVLGEGQDWQRESGTLIPNFFGITQPIGPGVFGFSYVVTDAIQEDQDQTFTQLPNRDRFTINLNNNQWVYKLGPSYAIRVNEQLSVGASFYFHFRDQEEINNQLIVVDAGTGPGAGDSDIEWRYLQTQNDEWGIKPVIGVMWEPHDRLAIGSSIRWTNVLGAENYIQFTCHGSSLSESTLCPEGDIDYVEARDNIRRDHPWEWRVGAAWFHSPRLVISGDFSYHSAFHDAVRGANGREVEATWNAAMGVEYYLRNDLALRGGLFTNNANTPSEVVQYDHVNMLGFSASVARFTRNSSLDLGFSYAAGRGQGQVLPVDRDPQTVEASSLTVFLSSSYTF